MELIIYTIVGIFLFFALYGFTLVVAGTTYKSREEHFIMLPKIKVLLPAYQPDETFLKVLEHLKWAIKQHPVEVFILFQHADESIVKAAKTHDFSYEERQFDHLEGNSYRHALQYLCQHHLDEQTDEYTMILDKDNIIDVAFFDRLMRHPLNHYDVIQGARKPIKTTEGIQLFDAISERYNDLMLRKGKLQLGGALEVSGSAAIIQTALFKYAIQHMDEQAPGYDKNFMVKLLTCPIKLHTLFDDQLIVREEKTAEIENYQSQRLRWFGEQYYNAFYNCLPLLKAAFLKGKLRSLDYLITLVRPPRSLQLVGSAILCGFDLIDLQISYISIPFLLNAMSFAIIAIPIMNSSQIKQLINGFSKVLLSNATSSFSCLKKKYLNKFIHTR